MCANVLNNTKPVFINRPIKVFSALDFQRWILYTA